MKLLSTNLLAVYGFDIRLLWEGGLAPFAPDPQAMLSLSGATGFNFKIFGKRGISGIRWKVSKMPLDVIWYEDLPELSNLLAEFEVVRFYTQDSRILSTLRRQSYNWLGWQEFLRSVNVEDKRKSIKWRP